MPAPALTHRLVTPRTGSGGAIAIVQVSAESPEELDRFLERTSLGSLTIGEVRLRDLLGVDHGLAARWSPTSAQLMPHGGSLVVQNLERALDELGATGSSGAPTLGDLRNLYPEARDAIEACAMDTIARAASADAIDAVLEHASRLRAHGVPDFDESLAPLGALVEPALVVCAGPANAGKSSLLNALAKRDVSIVSDIPGTTRDHVGVMLELDGLVVRWVDTPGEREDADALESRARELAIACAANADLILRAADASVAFPTERDVPRELRVGTKSDLAPVPGADVPTSATRGQGLAELASAVRERIVPDSALQSGGLWRFHPLLDSAIGS